MGVDMQKEIHFIHNHYNDDDDERIRLKRLSLKNSTIFFPILNSINTQKKKILHYLQIQLL